MCILYITHELFLYNHTNVNTQAVKINCFGVIEKRIEKFNIFIMWFYPSARELGDCFVSEIIEHL